MDYTEVIEEYLANTKSLEEGTYCFILYTISGEFDSIRKVRKIYKDCESFKDRLEKDCKSIDSMFGLAIEIYIFD